MKQIFKVFLINTAVFVALLLLLEFVLGLIDFQKNNRERITTAEISYNRRLHAPFLDAVKIPDKNYLKYTDGLEAEPFRFVTNRDGLILGPSQYNKGSLEECDILFLGGSTTECLYVQDSIRFPYLVGEILTEALNKPVVTLNAGISANNTLHSLTNLIYTGLAYKPKTVVLMQAINDVALLCKTGSYFISPESRALIIRKEASKIKKAKFHSFLISQYFPLTYRLFKNSRAKMVQNPPAEVDDFHGFRGTDIPEAVILEEYGKALESFYQICKAYSIKLVIMTEFSRMNIADPDHFKRNTSEEVLRERVKWYPTCVKVNEMIRKFAREKGVSLIDLEQKIPSNSQYIYDYGHLNNKGSALAGQLIANYFLEHQLID